MLPRFGSFEGEVLRAGLVSILMLAILATAEVWRRRGSPEVETTRKFVHLSMGLLGLLLPWLLTSAITLAVLIVPAIALFIVARRRGWLRSVLGVERRSVGDILFPVAVLALFAIGRQERVFYTIAMLSLVACDSLAAVLGRAYGRHAYAIEGDTKSFEGSAVFLLAAFLGVHLPLLLFTDIGRAESVVIALQLALLVTSFEALSTDGLDNLFVPLGTYYLLHKLTPQPLAGIAVQLAVQLGLLTVTLLAARLTKVLTFSGALASHLVLYAAFSLGQPGWVVATLLAFVAFIALDTFTSRMSGVPRGGYQLQAIFYIAVVSVLLTFADNTRSILLGEASQLVAAHPFRVPFVGALAASAATVAYLQFASVPSLRPRWKRGLAGAAYGLVAVGPLGLFFSGDLGWEPALVVVGMTFASIVLARLGRLLLSWPRTTAWDLRLVALSVLLAAMGALPLHFWWLHGSMAPMP